MAFPGTYNFNYYRGDTFQFIVRPKDSSSAGIPFDLTDYTAAFTVADKRGSGAVQYSGTAVVNSIDDIVTCTLSASTGRNIVPGTAWVYDVQITDGVNIYTLLTGSITSTDDVTGAGS